MKTINQLTVGDKVYLIWDESIEETFITKVTKESINIDYYYSKNFKRNTTSMSSDGTYSIYCLFREAKQIALYNKIAKLRNLDFKIKATIDESNSIKIDMERLLYSNSFEEFTIKKLSGN